MVVVVGGGRGGGGGGGDVLSPRTSLWKVCQVGQVFPDSRFKDLAPLSVGYGDADDVGWRRRRRTGGGGGGGGSSSSSSSSRGSWEDGIVSKHGA